MDDKYDIADEKSGTILKGQRKRMMYLLASQEFYEPYPPAAPGFPNAKEEDLTKGIIDFYNRLLYTPGVKEQAEQSTGRVKIYEIVGRRYYKSASTIYKILDKAGAIQHKRK